MFFDILQELEDKFLGQQASVAILDVSREENKLVCSIVRANENNRMRRLEVKFFFIKFSPFWGEKKLVDDSYLFSAVSICAGGRIG